MESRSALADRVSRVVAEQCQEREYGNLHKERKAKSFRIDASFDKVRRSSSDRKRVLKCMPHLDNVKESEMALNGEIETGR